MTMYAADEFYLDFPDDVDGPDPCEYLDAHYACEECGEKADPDVLDAIGVCKDCNDKYDRLDAVLRRTA